jgi:hypothetical protein
MRLLTFVALLITSRVAEATNCTAYAIGDLGPSGLYKWIRIAAPPGAQNTKLILEARNANKNAPPGTWQPCAPDTSCQGLPGVGYHNISEYPTNVFHETGISNAWVINYGNQGGNQAEFRAGVDYDWSEPNCRAVAWDRIEHNGGTGFRIAVPISSQIIGSGVVRARDGDNGQPWYTCVAVANHSVDCNPPGNVGFDAITAVADASNTLKGFSFAAYNGSNDRVRNVIVYFDFSPSTKKPIRK